MNKQAMKAFEPKKKNYEGFDNVVIEYDSVKWW